MTYKLKSQNTKLLDLCSTRPSIARNAFSIGVEEEYFIVDRETLDLVAELGGAGHGLAALFSWGRTPDKAQPCPEVAPSPARPVGTPPERPGSPYGPTLSSEAFPADPVANSLGVPVVATSNTAKGIPQIGKYIFRLGLGGRLRMGAEQVLLCLPPLLVLALCMKTQFDPPPPPSPR